MICDCERVHVSQQIQITKIVDFTVEMIKNFVTLELICRSRSLSHIKMEKI